MLVINEQNALPTLMKMQKLFIAFEDDSLTVPQAVEVFEDLHDNYGEVVALESYHKHYRRAVRPGLEFNEQYLTMGAAAVLGAAAIAAVLAIVKIIKKVIAWFKDGGGDSVSSMADIDHDIKSNHLDSKIEDAAKDLAKDSHEVIAKAGKPSGDKADGKKAEAWETFRDDLYEKHLSSPNMKLWLVFDDMDKRYEKAVIELNHCNATLKKFEEAIEHTIATIVTKEAYTEAEQKETLHSARGLFGNADSTALDMLDLSAYFPITEGKPASKWMAINSAPVAAAGLISAISQTQKHFAIDFDSVQELFETFEKKLSKLLETKIEDKESPEYYRIKASIAAHQTAVRIMTNYIQSVMRVKAHTQNAIRFSKLFLEHYCAYMDRMGMSSSNDNLRRMGGLLKELQTTILDRIKQKGA